MILGRHGLLRGARFGSRTASSLLQWYNGSGRLSDFDGQFDPLRLRLVGDEHSPNRRGQVLVHSEARQRRRMYRPWSYRGARYQAKRIVVRSGGRLSLTEALSSGEALDCRQRGAEVTLTAASVSCTRTNDLLANRL
jgi:hypothetical protein